MREMKKKEVNYYVGKKGYFDVIQLPVKGTQPMKYPLNILESFENICLAEVSNEVHVYFITEDDIAERALEIPWYNEDGSLRFSGTKEELKTQYDLTVEKRKQDNINSVSMQAIKNEEDRRKADREKAAILKAAQVKEYRTRKRDLQFRIKELKEGKSLKQMLKDKILLNSIQDLIIMEHLTP